MKRKLNKEEQKACRIGINSRKKQIKYLERELRYFIEFNTFNDKWASYLEEKEIKRKEKKQQIVKESLTFLEESLIEEKRLIKIEQNQLKNGVEIKQMAGVS
jgi:hypothetical protein